MAQKQKVNQVIAAVGLFMISAIALTFTVGLALLPAEGGKVISPILGTYKANAPRFNSAVANILLWLLMPIPFVFALEGGIWRLKEGLGMRKQALSYKPKTIWSKFAAFNQYMSILNAGFFMLLFILAIGFILHELWYSPKVISLNIILYGASIVFYLLIRKRLAGVWNRFVKWFRKGMPTYKLTQDGVIIKLVTMANKKYPDPPPVHIYFDEIDDLQVLTYTEADAFLKYNIGPDIQLSVRQAQDFAAYVKGQIPRPTVYTFGGATDNRVLIRGPELFYMIQFDADDVSDLIGAYRSYKGLPERPASCE